MAFSEAGIWLEDSLLLLSSDVGSGLQMDSDLVNSLVSYCEMATPSDAAEYLMNIVADDRCKDIVAEYLRRRGGGTINVQGNTTQQATMQAYVKPRDDDSWSTATKKAQKQKIDENAYAQRDSVQKSSTWTGSLATVTQTASGQKGKQVGGKGRRGGKGVTLAEAAQGLVVFKRSGPCNCQCTRHQLISNCLSCGRIVCEQEGEGPCTFCGALVLKEGSDYAGLDGVAVPLANEAELKAEEFKNRLVEYDRTSAARTTVIDDQSDYFQIDGNTWLTDKEKQLLKKRQEDEERIAEERRKRVVVTIDLLGRKVIMASPENAEGEKEGISILGGDSFVGKEVLKVPRIKPNPYVKESPLFIDEKRPAGSGKSGKLGQKRSGATVRSARVQHDDPVVEALIGHNLEDIGISSLDELNSAWQAPKATTSGRVEEDENFECRLDMGALNLDSAPSAGKGESSQSREGSSPEVFDICLPRSKSKQSPVVLAPSLLKQKQAERMEAANGSFNVVIQDGLILLKRWLTIDQQVEIVKQCRQLGLGPGGFYHPQYAEKDKMHLKMMCLGMQWQPAVRSYGPRRTNHDNALAPPIPESFLRIVDKALSVAQVLSAQESGGKSKRVVIDRNSTVPDMVPNICILNFYESSGNLGMHQDKDESPQSLKKGIPVVSLSVGDSGEFLYGKDNNPETAEKLILDSGDVLIFGGPSRMIFHGVHKIIRATAPEALLQKSNLRPGRLNLTFRQY